MDKLKRMKTILAVGFVVISGTVCVAVSCGEWGDDRIVLEKQEAPELTSVPTEAVDTEEFPAGEAGAEVTVSPNEQKAEIRVHVCGAVVREGVYTLSGGSRVTDGIAAAGGFLETADTAYLNLAAFLADGQKVYVPTREETSALSAEERLSGDAERMTTPEGETSAEKETQLVNLNTATLAELMTLSGIGEAKAASIIQYREKVGPFRTIEDLKNVSGIGDGMFARVKENITVE